jgi:NADP-dependent 3-hydroxy acid dehydrogenase YdfG
MVVDTNIKGTANVLRHFVPLMIEKRHGIIINLSSGWGRSAAAEVRQKAIKCIIVVSFC